MPCDPCSSDNCCLTSQAIVQGCNHMLFSTFLCDSVNFAILAVQLFESKQEYIV